MNRPPLQCSKENSSSSICLYLPLNWNRILDLSLDASHSPLDGQGPRKQRIFSFEWIRMIKSNCLSFSVKRTVITGAKRFHGSVTTTFVLRCRQITQYSVHNWLVHIQDSIYSIYHICYEPYNVINITLIYFRSCKQNVSNTAVFNSHLFSGILHFAIFSQTGLFSF